MSTPTLAEFEFEIGARIARGDFSGADSAASAFREAFPAARSSWLLGSFAALCADKKDLALTLIEKCLAADPADVQYLLQQAECLLALGRIAEAAAAAATAGASPRADTGAIGAAVQFLIKSREYTSALTILDKTLTAAPTSVAALAQRSAVHRSLGNFDLAARDFETVLAVSPLHPDALKGLVDLEQQSPERNHLAALHTALAQVPPQSLDATVLHFALAKSHDDMGDYPVSWEHLLTANRLERAHSDYNPENDRRVIDEILSNFPHIEPKHHDTTREQPIFIVGLPRTGTTLAERIIGSHSQVHSAGELPALSQAIGAAMARTAVDQPRTWVSFAERLSQLDSEFIADEYLKLSRPQRGNRARFSDKQPTNFFYCALILRAFPNARIVHVTRHPLAACHAIYKTRFDSGFPFAYDLTELGDFFIGYRRLMQHWHQVLPGRILDIAYEDIIVTQEAATRSLLDYLDLPFEPACLDFHLNPAAVTNTASALQVRQPLYESSLHQWRHYSDALAPLRARLEAAGIEVA